MYLLSVPVLGITQIFADQEYFNLRVECAAQRPHRLRCSSWDQETTEQLLRYGLTEGTLVIDQQLATKPLIQSLPVGANYKAVCAVLHRNKYRAL